VFQQLERSRNTRDSVHPADGDPVRSITPGGREALRGGARAWHLGCV
jgi:hypothetical protein